MEILVSSCKRRNGSGRPRDKIVVDNVRAALARAVSSYITATSTPVIDDLFVLRLAMAIPMYGINRLGKAYVVLEVVHALNLRVPSLVVDVQVAE